MSVLICAPGSDVYELEGHAALRLDYGDGRDFTFNWGLFDFDSPNFIYRFCAGQTDYTVGYTDTGRFVRSYARHGRRVSEIALDLSEAERAEIERLVMENIKPQNRVYRYNYVLDNCATRVLSVVERALGADSLRLSAPAPDVAQSAGDGNRPTFRSVMRRYHRNYPWYQFGIDMALGPGIDRPVSDRELTFAPHTLERMLSGATTASGRHIAAATPAVLSPGSPDGTAEGPTPTLLTPMAAGLILLAAGIAVTIGDIRRRRRSRGFDCALFSAVGLAGCVVAFLVFISEHEATSPNYIILWLNPLAFIAAVGVWINRAKRAVICYQIVNFALILALMLIWAFGVQSLNAAFAPFMLLDMLRSAFDIYRYRRL